jgi:agmatinase
MNKAYSELTSEINLKDGHKLLTIGGEHSISYFPISKYLKEYENLTIIHLDAHADFRDGYLGDAHSHASIMKRTHEQMGKNHRLIQYGIRSGTKDEFLEMKKYDTLCHSREEFLSKVHTINSDEPVYLTLDLDYFDPAYMPGTGTPEAGGEDFHSFISLMKILNDCNLVGADIVELAPTIDLTGNSSVFAAKVMREVLLAMN